MKIKMTQEIERQEKTQRPKHRKMDAVAPKTG